jgi:cytosine/adenosine deaminase-related metal-dependent hydrolase
LLLCARWLLIEPELALEGGGLVVRGGRVLRVLGSRDAVRRWRGPDLLRIDLGEGWVTPGLVNAHAHLELGTLHRALTGRAGFAGWIRGLLESRGRVTQAERVRALCAGARRALTTGTTTVGDIDSTGAARSAGALPLRLVSFREVLDAWAPRRTSAALRRVRRALPRRARRAEGLSPHAPYTTSRALLGGVAELARRRRVPLAIHWAESQEEREWLLRGTGPLAALLPESPRASGLQLIDQAGLVGPRTALIHANHPERGDVERVARAGSTLVHCPGTHAYFGRAPFPWRRWGRAGVPVALGTDSLASNDDIDLRREMALARAAAPDLGPATTFAAVTRVAARAVGMAGRIGTLRPGACADLVVWSVAARDRRTALEQLTLLCPALEQVWIAGRCARGSADSSVDWS